MLTVMTTGNDYLPRLPLSVAYGPNVTSTYLQMRRAPRWRHRGLVVVDRQRRITGALPNPRHCSALFQLIIWIGQPKCAACHRC